MKRFIWFLLCILIISLVGCKPTPQKEKLLTDETVKYTSAVNLIDTLTDGITVNINAEVTAAADSFPKGRYITKPFTDGEIQSIYNALCGDAKPYQWAETSDNLIFYAAYARTMLSRLEKDISQEQMEFELQSIQEILNAAASAPAQKDPADLEKILSYDDGIVEIYLGKNWDASFQVREEPYSMLSFSNYGYPDNENITCRTPIKLAQNEAVNKAEFILRQLGLDSAFSLANVTEEPVNHSVYEMMMKDETKTHAYRLLFLREVNGLPQLDNQCVTLGTQRQYTYDFHQEYIEFLIDDIGILSFIWQSPGEIMVTDESVNLITLDDATTCMLKRLSESYNKYTFAGADASKISIQINRIAIGCICIPSADDAADVIPAWEFYGYIADNAEAVPRYYNLESNSWEKTHDDNACICTVNAMNGEIIDRIGRYDE